jgi:hypothetical protein
MQKKTLRKMKKKNPAEENPEGNEEENKCRRKP